MALFEREQAIANETFICIFGKRIPMEQVKACLNVIFISVLFMFSLELGRFSAGQMYDQAKTLCDA